MDCGCFTGSFQWLSQNSIGTVKGQMKFLVVSFNSSDINFVALMDKHFQTPPDTLHTPPHTLPDASPRAPRRLPQTRRRLPTRSQMPSTDSQAPGQVPAASPRSQTPPDASQTDQEVLGLPVAELDSSRLAWRIFAGHSRCPRLSSAEEMPRSGVSFQRMQLRGRWRHAEPRAVENLMKAAGASRGERPCEF